MPNIYFLDRDGLEYYHDNTSLVFLGKRYNIVFTGDYNVNQTTSARLVLQDELTISSAQTDIEFPTVSCVATVTPDDNYTAGTATVTRNGNTFTVDVDSAAVISPIYVRAAWDYNNQRMEVSVTNFTEEPLQDVEVALYRSSDMTTPIQTATILSLESQREEIVRYDFDFFEYQNNLRENGSTQGEPVVEYTVKATCLIDQESLAIAKNFQVTY